MYLSRPRRRICREAASDGSAQEFGQVSNTFSALPPPHLPLSSDALVPTTFSALPPPRPAQACIATTTFGLQVPIPPSCSTQELPCPTVTLRHHHDATTATRCHSRHSAQYYNSDTTPWRDEDSNTARGVTKTSTRHVALRQRHSAQCYNSDMMPRRDKDSNMAPWHGEDNDTAPQYGEDSNTVPWHGEYGDTAPWPLVYKSIVTVRVSTGSVQVQPLPEPEPNHCEPEPMVQFRVRPRPLNRTNGPVQGSGKKRPHKADEGNPVVDNLFFGCHLGDKVWDVERQKRIFRVGVAAISSISSRHDTDK
ncbi:hypothetical protein EDB86DRAFT_2829523 [Lactarius hatsudake]|nr:hypothetical protein EDB86DRAFT_2829523 [Lactarius hatsudake]